MTDYLRTFFVEREKDAEPEFPYPENVYKFYLKTRDDVVWECDEKVQEYLKELKTWMEKQKEK